MKLRLDEGLTLLFLWLLLALGVVTRSRFFEPLGEGRLTWLTLLALPLIILFAIRQRATTSAGAAIRAWWPVIGVLAVYESLKHMHANRITIWLGIAPQDRLMLRLDELLFGKALPLWLDAWSHPAFISVMRFFYVWVYYLSPVVLLGLAFARRDFVLFYRLRLALVLGLLGGYVLYILVPVAGPLFLIGDQFTNPIRTHRVIDNLVFDLLRYEWDCFPSLHTAIPWLLTFVAWYALRPWQRLMAVIGSTGVMFATVALRYHYGIDLIAGVAWAGLVYYGVREVNVSLEESVAAPAPAVAARRWGPVRRRAATLAMLFVGTGAVGLITEQAFEKLLSTLIGASTPAGAVVLSTYFLGFTLGSASYGRWIRPRARNPLLLYAIVEAGIAVWAVLLSAGLTKLIPLFAPVLSAAFGNDWLLHAARLLIAAIWILPPTFLMGISFPAVVDALQMLRMPSRSRSVARFYAFNLVGAIAGAALAPYVFFPLLGLDGALLLCAALDALVCLIAYRMARSTTRRFRPQADAGAAVEAVVRGSMTSPSVLLIVAFVSGFLFFSLEVVWTHLLAAVIGNSVYSFATMLTVVLLGLGIGGAIVGTYGPGLRTLPPATTGALFLLGSLTLSLTHGLWSQTPHALATGGPPIGFMAGELLRFRHALMLVLPPAVVFGMVFPSLFRQQGLAENPSGSTIGIAYASNSIGCIAGALIAGFVILPNVGSETTLRLIAMAAAMIGIIPLVASLRGLPRFAAVAVCVASLAFTTVYPWDRLQLTSGEHVYFARHQVFPASQLLFFHEDTLGGITTVVKNPGGSRSAHDYLTLLTNGKFQGNDSWEMQAQTGFALVPMMFGRHHDDALVIGAGTGHTAGVVRKFGYRHIDVAEIAPGILEAARTHFNHINGGVLDAPNVRVFLEDGRNLMLLRKARYDLITIEISSIWFAGSANLYSREFYELASGRLKPGGVIQQWIQLHHIGPAEVKSVIATMREVFPHVSLWVVGGQGVVVGSHHPQLMTAEFGRRFLSSGLVSGSPEPILTALLSSRLLAPNDVSRLVESESVTLNTDRNRLLEYRTPRYNLSVVDYRRLNIRVLGGSASFERQAAEENLPPPIARSVAGVDARSHFIKSLQPGGP